MENTSNSFDLATTGVNTTLMHPTQSKHSDVPRWCYPYCCSTLTDILSMNCFMFFTSLLRKSFIKHKYSSFTPNRVKLARFWITLATSVSFLAIFSSGYSREEEKARERKEGGREEERKRK